jgi:hypothetical protein
MKKHLFLFLLIPFTNFSQSKLELQSATTKFHQANFLMEFDAIAELTYPKVYEAIGKTAFTEKLDKDFQNDEYRMRLQLEKVPFLFSEIKTIGTQTFCVVRCRNPKRYTFEKKLTTATAEEKKAFLQEKEKTQNVTFEPTRNSFNVRSESIYVAVLDAETYAEWKFFNLDDAFQLTIFNQLFDENVKISLGLNN